MQCTFGARFKLRSPCAGCTLPGPVPALLQGPPARQTKPTHLHTLLRVALQRLPVAEAVAVPLFDVHSLVGVAAAQRVVVDVAHHGGLDLQWNVCICVRACVCVCVGVCGWGGGGGVRAGWGGDVSGGALTRVEQVLAVVVDMEQWQPDTQQRGRRHTGQGLQRAAIKQ